MKQKFRTLLILITLVLAACNSNAPDSPAYILTAKEKSICDSMQVDTTIVSNIRLYNSSEMEPFHYSFSKIISSDGVEREADPMYLKGLVFKEKNEKSYSLVLSLKDDFKKKGYSIFLLENNFGFDNAPDYIGVLKTTDKYTVLKQVGTDGINYDITNDSLLTVIRQFDAKYPLDLIGASGDWCEFVILNEPSSWLDFAKEVYAVCPDVVEQGTGTVEALAEEMKKTKRLYFWWD